MPARALCVFISQDVTTAYLIQIINNSQNWKLFECQNVTTVT